MSLTKPKVLLLESGKSYLEDKWLVGFDRWPLAMDASPLHTEIMSAPQQCLDGRQVSLSSGRALGGGSAINVGMWTVGHEADYNEWARIVNDESYSWQSIRRHLQRLENYGSDISPSLGEYSHPEEWHGKSGEVRLEFSGDDMTNAGSILSAFIESGNSVNLDVNSGKSLGIGVVPITTRDSWRVSAATAHLTDPPSNLQILTDATVSRIILKDGRASGVVVGETACKLANFIFTWL